MLFFENLRDAFLFFVGVPACAVTIQLDRWLPWNPLLSFPRTVDEAFQRPDHFFALLQTSTLAGELKTATLVKLERGPLLATEPEKNRQVAVATLTYRPNGSKTEKTLEIFIKCPTVRRTSLFVRALGSAFTAEHKEPSFYKYVQTVPGMPIASPKCIFAAWNRMFHRICIVLEKVPSGYISVTDFEGQPLERMVALASEAAKFHAKFWKPSLDQFPFLAPRERDGTGWISGVIKLYLDPKKDPPWRGPLWDAMNKYFTGEAHCLSHGDCRAGNMMFPGPNAPKNGPSVIFTDWEAVAITPYLWDFTYMCIVSQTIEERRERHSLLLKVYRDSLVAHGVAESEIPMEKVHLQYTLLALCIEYFGWVLDRVGGVGDSQGNTMDDVVAWRARIVSSNNELLSGFSKNCKNRKEGDGPQPTTACELCSALGGEYCTILYL